MDRLLGVVVDVLKSNGGAFGLVVLFGLLFLWLAFWLYGKAIQICCNHGTLKESCNANDANIRDIKTDLIVIKANIKIIAERMGMQGVVQSHSPLSLTEKGRTVSSEINAENMISRSWESVIASTLDRDLSSRNPYDIQQYCMEKIPVFPEKFFSPKDVDDIKLYAYRKGMTTFECLQVLGIMIRDKYLAAKGIDVSEIDKHEAATAHLPCR